MVGAGTHVGPVHLDSLTKWLMGINNINCSLNLKKKKMLRSTISLSTEQVIILWRRMVKQEVTGYFLTNCPELCGSSETGLYDREDGPERPLGEDISWNGSSWTS